MVFFQACKWALHAASLVCELRRKHIVLEEAVADEH